MIPVVIAGNGRGIPVIAVERNAPAAMVASNGFGMPIVLVEKNGTPMVIDGLHLASYDFTTGVYDGPAIANVSASGGMVDNLAGAWSAIAPNTLRRSNKGLLIEASRTNSIRNSTMQGAVVGSPGTSPTNWSGLTGATNGITGSIVAIGTEGGLAYVDVRFAGTADASSGRVIRADGTQQVAGVLGQSWSMSAFCSLVAAPALNGATIRAFIQEANAAGGPLVNAQGSALTPTVGPLGARRCTVTRVLANASVAFVIPALNIPFTAGQAYDFTLRIGVPQLELGATTTSPIPTTNAAVTRSVDAVSLTLPTGSDEIQYVFSDDTTQTVPVSPGSYTIPTNLNRRTIKRMVVS